MGLSFQSYDPKSSKSWPWLSNVVLKPAVEGCEILHHQKDGWNPNKIMGCLASINCRISQPSEASATPSKRRFLGRGSGAIDGTNQTSHGKLGNFWTKMRWKWRFTLWLCQNSYWKWPVIVDFPMKNGDFPYVMLNYQRFIAGKMDGNGPNGSKWWIFHQALIIWNANI